MRRPLRFLIPVVALSLGLSACSLLVDFDEEGQPCDDRNQCLEGFACEDDVCIRDDSAIPDAGTGTDSGTDSGTPGPGPVDAGPVDAGPVDAGPVDSGQP
ncbi:hypothetical protein [Myxococcus qinghaiensis]|uniref:hypothetical protein n=1 Tax=Myxococcus qinghaiensis TaxID=2906758 RepID=UPI0020A7AE5F|nr:hypothetical protein [Myxococcus qinghaiensis]MCP3162753.1 hypothetical protein [Myxococcus qinghaiensis]